MGGSQLKNLKATLKSHGLTGQANVKKSKKNKPSKEYDREERQKVISKIREQFNPFDVKTNRNKNANSTINPLAKIAVGKPGITKQIGEDQRKMIYQARKASKNKTGGLLDKRFGEKSKDLTAEEIMLERFTKERQKQSSSKRSLFNLDDENDDEGAFDGNLTHYGKSLAFQDDFADGDLGVEDSDGEGFQKRGRSKYEDGSLGDDVDEPHRKKTKAEVMQEIIAKSKFHKQERQKAQQKLEDDIEDLDENFEDVMSELRTVPRQKPASNVMSAPSDILNYDMKVKELVMDKRAAPADRTKTDEEIRKEHEEKQKELEQKRIDRMSGMVDVENSSDKGVEDLDDGFWAGSDSEEGEYGEYMNEIADSDDDILFREEDKKSEKSELVASKEQSVPCPQTHDEFIDFLGNFPSNEHYNLIRKIIKTYQPKLAEGNKERLGVFSGILLRHTLFLAEEDYSNALSEVSVLQSSIIGTLKLLSEKFTQPLAETCREIITEIQNRFGQSKFYGLSPSDLLFFSIVGMLFSTSDHYHLVVTPCSILISEILEQTKYNSIQKLYFGAILVRISIQYQRVSKRYIPEIVYFLQNSLLSLMGCELEKDSQQDKLAFEISLPSDESLDFKNVDSTLKLHKLFDTDLDQNTEIKTTLIDSLLSSLDWQLINVWKDSPALSEIILPFKEIMHSLSTRFANYDKANQILDKMNRLKRLQNRVPLTFQVHKPMAIPSNAPKFEENFNPDKKSYDPDKTRNEINKMKAQLKKERKFTMKEIRKDTKYEARQRISEKKKEYEEYHTKMARLFNQISTVEGAEKNKYEKEKKARNSKR